MTRGRAPRNQSPRVLITRERPAPLAEAVSRAGGEPVTLPLLVTRWLEFEIPAGRKLDDYDCVAFTSRKAVEAVERAAVHNRWGWPPEAGAAAVGDRTAHELQARGWMPDCVAENNTAQSLVDCLAARGLRGKRLLFPCSALAEQTLPTGCRQAGADVDVVAVYTTETPWTRDPSRQADLAGRLAASGSDCIVTCASPSAVRAFAELAEVAGILDVARRTPLVVLGPTTEKAALDAGFTAITPATYTLAALARKAVEIGRSLG